MFLPIVSEFSCGAPECDSLEAKAFLVKLPSLWADSSWVMLVAGSQIPVDLAGYFPAILRRAFRPIACRLTTLVSLILHL